jgi:hypothetical protein
VPVRNPTSVPKMELKREYAFKFSKNNETQNKVKVETIVLRIILRNISTKAVKESKALPKKTIYSSVPRRVIIERISVIRKVLNTYPPMTCSLDIGVIMRS